MQALNAAVKSLRLRDSSAWGSGTRLEGKVSSVHVSRISRERRANLVVWKVWLSRVWEQRQDSGNTLRRASLARRDHDAEVDKVVVDLAAARLDDIDILSTDRVLDLKTALADRKLGKDSLACCNAEGVTDGLDQLRVRLPAEDHDIACHCWRCCRLISSVECGGRYSWSGRFLRSSLLASGQEMR